MFTTLRTISVNRRIPGLVMAMLWCVSGSATMVAAAAPDVPDLLRTYCLGCHNNVDREAGVSLLSAATILEGSEHGPLLDRDDPTRSRLLQVLLADDDSRMPPEGADQPSAAERKQLTSWVRDGAPLSSSIAVPQVPGVPVSDPRPTILSAVSTGEGDVVVGGLNRITRQQADRSQVEWSVHADFGKVSGLTLTPDGHQLVAAGGIPGVRGTAYLLDMDTGEQLRTFSGHADALYAAQVSPSGQQLATAGYDRQILIHDMHDGTVLQTLRGHNGSVFDLCFDPSGQVICTASADGTVKVWSVATGERLDTLSQPTAEQYCVAVSPDGERLFAAGADNRIRVWSLLSRKNAQINPLLSSTFAHEKTIVSLALSTDGRQLATAAEDGTVRVWSTDNLVQQGALPRQPALVTDLEFLPDGQLFVTRIDGSAAATEIPAVSGMTTVSASADTDSVPGTVPASAAPVVVSETEDNNTVEQAPQVDWPVTISGTINAASEVDRDCFRFQASAGQQLVLEVQAASRKEKSPLDSVVEVLDEQGQPVLRTRLQAVRDSWYTFRGKDSIKVDDFRVFYWQEMELNDFLYSDGEVVRLWQYPRGPDSGFKVYPGFGSRHTWFDTTPSAHALQAPCYVVIPRDPGEEITPNGLPVFPIYFRNDDDPERERGDDSRLLFTAPRDGLWTVRLTDARGFQGPDFQYDLTIRPPQPDFQVSASPQKLTVSHRAGQEIEFTVDRQDRFRGPIRIEAHNLPDGFHMSSGVVIEQDQFRAQATLFAVDSAQQPTPEQVQAIRFEAVADIRGERRVQPAGTLEELTLKDAPRLRVHVLSEQGQQTTVEQPLRLEIRPGQTIRAFVRLERLDCEERVQFGKAEACRNLPFSVFVDNTGLNGLLIPPDRDEREFFVTAAPVATPGRRTFFLKSSIDGLTSLPVELDVLPAAEPVAAR